jgi:hypothetical protein
LLVWDNFGLAILRFTFVTTMTEPDRSLGSSAAADHESPPSPAAPAQRAASTTDPDAVASALRSLERVATCVQWGLLATGCLAASRDAALVWRDGTFPEESWIGLAAQVGVTISCYGLAGWGLAASMRFTAAVVGEYLARTTTFSNALGEDCHRLILVLDQIAKTVDRAGGLAAGGAVPDAARQRAVAEIERVTRGASWSEAERLLAEFEAGYPDDPASAVLLAQLGQARDKARSDQLAELEAARNVNDPERVLEIYRQVGPAFEAQSRGVLERELGKWFLSLIHRRLRSGKVQPDVVLLAGRFAEVFAATPEGASVRASLPTLRRSVGLCPRCAQAYTGVADACPKCLAGPPAAGSHGSTNGEASSAG